MSKRSGTSIQRFRVPLGFLFAAVFLYFAEPKMLFLVIGGVIAVVGILIRAWASGHIRKNQNLAVSGPYAYTRNPLYLGSFILGLGFTIASGVWWLGFIFIALFLGIYLPVMRVEAKDLTKLFGADYEEYAGKVPLFFPRITVYKASDAKFDMNLYLHYREYRAALGLIFAWSVLLVKAIFLG
ncbi:MAG: isoprenylcysteine carboxylmethyltransferase family protein [Acidobacteria bacterium]|jgi:protein-S-isoprenylcysteine O-methyltransferase Ste14|nr:isoprenylcysteine carboxylmethyltransferase family protein [Acidobacteriota bacterium]